LSPEASAESYGRIDDGARIIIEPQGIPPDTTHFRNDLIRAGEALSQDQKTPGFYSATVQRRDELGEVIGAFRLMYRQIADAINNRKKAEIALQESFHQRRLSPAFG